jgi:hypothetical protein
MQSLGGLLREAWMIFFANFEDLYIYLSYIKAAARGSLVINNVDARHFAKTVFGT